MKNDRCIGRRSNYVKKKNTQLTHCWGKNSRYILPNLSKGHYQETIEKMKEEKKTNTYIYRVSANKREIEKLEEIRYTRGDIN